jgi:hypothetical protein
LDFSFGEGKAPNGYKSLEVMPLLEAGDGRRLVPCMAFFGANAAGKSNILKAFGCLKLLVINGNALAEVFEPNLLNPKFAETTFEPTFVIDGDSFTYRITYSQTAICEEVLLKNGDPLFRIRNLDPEYSDVILSPAYSKEKLADILRVECSDGEGRQTKPFLHRIGTAYAGLHADLKNAFGYFVRRMQFFANDGPMLLPVAVDVLAGAMGGDKTAALREITDLVRRSDIEIAAIEITETELGKDDLPSRDSLLKQDRTTGARHSVSITAAHEDAAGNPVLLNFLKHESAGTQRLAGIVGLILYALKTGSVFIVDELECSLHPLLMREIVLLFKKRRHNPKGAQIIFTTHNTDILDDSILRLSEIALVRKTVANGTLVRRLVEAKRDGEDIRNVTNFRKQYLAGFYSGVPHPAL